ncbi:MAG: GyrI-like domain-containing protein [Thermomicrobiales bacterium]
MNTIRPTLFMHWPAIHVVGIATRTTNDLERDPATASIGQLWQRFYREGVGDQIPDRVEPSAILGVYTDYESDHTGAYTLMLGFEVESLNEIPDGLRGITIPAADYAVFPVTGSMPDALIGKWIQIWSHFDGAANGRRSFQSDIEFHRTDPQTGEARVEIAIAVEPD